MCLPAFLPGVRCYAPKREPNTLKRDGKTSLAKVQQSANRANWLKIFWASQKKADRVLIEHDGSQNRTLWNRDNSQTRARTTHVLHDRQRNAQRWCTFAEFRHVLTQLECPIHEEFSPCNEEQSGDATSQPSIGSSIVPKCIASEKAEGVIVGDPWALPWSLSCVTLCTVVRMWLGNFVVSTRLLELMLMVVSKTFVLACVSNAATLLAYDFCENSKVVSCRKVRSASFRPLRSKDGADLTTQNPQKHKAKSVNINTQTRFSFPQTWQKYGCLLGDMQILTADIASPHKRLFSDKSLALFLLPKCDF